MKKMTSLISDDNSVADTNKQIQQDMKGVFTMKRFSLFSKSMTEANSLISKISFMVSIFIIFFSSPVFSGDYSFKRLWQTRFGTERSAENYDNKCYNVYEDIFDKAYVGDNTITHLLYPFQKDGMSGSVPGYQLSEIINGVIPKTGVENDQREPLIIVHGWRGDGSLIIPNGGLINPIELIKSENSAEQYWNNFLRYFALSDNKGQGGQTLKERYKIYIFQYPSYKHITYNGRLFSQMLFEVDYIKKYIEKGNKITILGHSMGGLVSRSMLEDHLKGRNPEEFLNKLITLDTPHHGTPGAVYSWVRGGEFLSKLGVKNLKTPGSFDLWWDGYDYVYDYLLKNNEIVGSKYLIIKEDADIATFSGKTQLSIDLINSVKDMEAFDEYYANKIELTWSENLSKTAFPFRRSPNPWLIYLNDLHRKKKDVWKGKYILYGGYNQNADHWSNRLYNNKSGGVADNPWLIEGVYDTGYINSGPVPIISNMFDDSSRKYDNDNGKSPLPPDTIIYKFLEDQAKNIFIGKNDAGYDARFFRDYWHDFMLNGAYGTKNTDLITNLCYECEVPVPGPSPIGGEVTRIGGEATRFCNCNERKSYDGFRSEDSNGNFVYYRENYLRDVGLSIINRSEVLTASMKELVGISVNQDEFSYAGCTKPWTNNFLKYEPLFIQLEKDLIGDTLPNFLNIEQYAQCNFPDIQGTQYKSAVMELCKNGVVRGYSDGLFKPDNQVTRAEFVKMVVLAHPTHSQEYSKYLKPPKSSFSDVKDDHWALGFIEYAKKEGIISGHSDGTFRPEENIIRAQICKIVLNAFGKTSEMSPDELKAKAITLIKNKVFTDISAEDITKLAGDITKTQWWYAGYAAVAKELKIMEGYTTCPKTTCTGNCFCPETPATRGETALVIYKAMHLNK